MLKFFSRIAIFIPIFFSILISTAATAQVSVIVTSAPPPREVVIEPPGYTSCYQVQPGFYNNVWHYQQRVCEYPGNAGMRIWVSGFWQCIGFRNGGICTRWNWVGGHWGNRHELIVYRRPPHRGYHQHHENIYINGHRNVHHHEDINVHKHENRNQNHHVHN